ncbi:IgGFc-binding protein-like [Crassostrea angulata]|uniref:IgGFc-binding protein-like n=1 Tax=Magallana angulata TaxID=2784310 RepID=UPI0022B20529|nr:IgGFc-binding protein-like [Crassostrea angulata]
MDLSIVRLVLLVIYMYLRLTKAISSESYQANPEFDNKVFVKDPLYNKTTGSVLICSALCGTGCNCFNFNLLTGVCLLFASCNPLHMTVPENGWRFFFDPTVKLNESEKTGFIVLFMAKNRKTMKDLYITTKKGAIMDITTSSRLNHTLKQQIDRRITISSSHHITIPSAIKLKSFEKEVKSILLETFDNAFCVIFDYHLYSSGGTAIVPLHKLSTKYVVISTEPSRSNYKSQFAFASIQNNTSISITFKMKRNISLYINEHSFLNGDVYNLTLDRFETYQISHETDLTGTVIESYAPIAVFSGNICNRLENRGACDHLIQQLIPNRDLDKTYIVPPNSNNRRTKIRITATENSTISYTIDGVTRTVTVNKLDSFDTIISSIQACVIESNTPITVTSFGLRSSSSRMGDPSMTAVSGINQYIDYYKTVVPSGFSFNYVTILMKQSLKNSIRINGSLINETNIVYEENVPVRNVTYSVRSVKVPEGVLTVYTVDGGKFGLVFSGCKTDAAYSFSAILL